MQVELLHDLQQAKLIKCKVNRDPAHNIFYDLQYNNKLQGKCS